MRLNTLKPAPGSRRERTRVGRGIGSGLGKTAGRGHKGQHARKGGYHKTGFEGGQMPLQRRLPKFGFASLKSVHDDQVTLGELNKLQEAAVNLQVLKDHDLVRHDVKRVKVVATGKLDRAVTLKGLRATKGARAAIEAAGGQVEE